MGVLAKPIPFGDYFLLEKLNTGGMAEVFKAKTFGAEGFERIVAVKKILPSIAEDKEFISMFINEAKLAVQLKIGSAAQPCKHCADKRPWKYQWRLLHCHGIRAGARLAGHLRPLRADE